MDLLSSGARKGIADSARSLVWSRAARAWESTTLRAATASSGRFNFHMTRNRAICLLKMSENVYIIKHLTTVYTPYTLYT